MKRTGQRRKRSMLLAIAVAAIAAGAIVASVSANGGPHRQAAPRAHSARGHAAGRHARRIPAERAVAARYLGLTRAQLRSKLRSGQSLAQIANATSGKSATGLIDALVSARQQARAASERSRITLTVDGVRTSLGRPTAAAYLGVSVAKLRQELRSGRSLAQVAAASSGKSVTGLIDALVSAREAQVKKAVASGALDQAVASKYLSSLRQRVTHAVDRPQRATAG